MGKELSRAQNYSEETARKIDSAIKEIIDQQYDRAKQILLDNINALHASANALLEYETIEGKHIHEILDHGKIISEIIKSPDVNNETLNKKTPRRKPTIRQRKIVILWNLVLKQLVLQHKFLSHLIFLILFITKSQ